MPLILICLLLAQGQPLPKGAGRAQGQVTAQDAEAAAKRAAANNKFRKLISGTKTLSVDLDVQLEGAPPIGHGTFVMASPDKLYFHLTIGKGDYTYAIHNGQAIEIDKGQKIYDEYAVAGLGEPEAYSSDWAVRYFPTVFLSEQTVLPAKFFDASGLVTRYVFNTQVGEKIVKTTVNFSNYKLDQPIPDSRFVANPPAEFDAVSTPRPAPPLQIGEILPAVHLTDGHGHATDLVRALGGKTTLVALLDPQCAPSISAVRFLKSVKDVPILALNDSANGKGLATSPLATYFSPAGGIAKVLRTPMTPLFYLVDGTGKISNVWYGFNSDDPAKFSKQVTDALAQLKS
jgi:hypothetical protein